MKTEQKVSIEVQMQQIANTVSKYTNSSNQANLINNDDKTIKNNKSDVQKLNIIIKPQQQAGDANMVENNYDSEIGNNEQQLMSLVSENEALVENRK